MSNILPEERNPFALNSGSLKKVKGSSQSLLNSAMTVLAGACLTITLLPLFAVLYYVAAQGFNRLNLDLFTKLPPAPGLSGGGIANAIVGTLMTVGIASLIAVPFGVLAAVYLSEFSSGNIARSVRFATNVLSGVPSIIAGVFAYGLFVVNMGGFSAIAGGAALAVLMLPTIVRTTDEALQIVPQDIRWASVGVGASNYQTVLQVVLPAAIPAILTGVTLAIARAAGETAPLIFTALNSPFWPAGFDKPTPSLSVLVYNFATVPFKAQKELAWAASLILVFMVLLTSILSRWATRQKVY
ncbi:phosphate ABC transporter permease PstA [Tychonema sp. BBK16]|uniref:phosphate ABC transporter permease PstA n=1 Tax=Tychonema sp. BBK16 TaxID=2699888 RepID=UPI001F4501D0|nr:phosphate ABC transporter permease PstA [Tychonema sp. BBK16]MCF6375876.1 phosphate ABC transporter permease PstA [Tychonema sp. BBK16]